MVTGDATSPHSGDFDCGWRMADGGCKDNPPSAIRHPPCSWPGLTVWFLVAGLALRVFHYWQNHTTWHDESVLLFNILGKDLWALLGPLDYDQAAPPLFLWALRGIAVFFGDQSYLWRLPPFLISCLTLVLIFALARRVCQGVPATLVVGLAAFSDAFVRLGCCVKPYILDACLASVLLYLFLRTEGWQPTRRYLLFACLAPLLLCLSYPMVFLLGGFLLAFSLAFFRSQPPKVWFAYALFAAAVAITFACLYFGPIRAQRGEGLVSFWQGKFPPTDRPATVPGWVVGNALLVFHYCYNPVGMLLAWFTAVGVWWCLRNRHLTWACACLAPLALCLAAAFARAYPFSGNRLMLFAAPGILLLAGLGLETVMARLWQRRWLAVGLCLILIVPEVGLCTWRVFRPWDYPDAAGVTRFIENHRHPGDLIASDEPNYSYFFFGELHSLEEVAGAAGRCREPSGTPGRCREPSGTLAWDKLPACLPQRQAGSLSHEQRQAGSLSYEQRQAGSLSHERGPLRVWVPIDHYTPERRRRYVLARLGQGWDVVLEKTFHRASALLLVKRTREGLHP